MQRKIIKKEELKAWLDSGKDFLLVDVLPPEYYAEKHIAGALNAPVYEIEFLQHIKKLTDDKLKTIVVYNELEKSLATVDAAEKLTKDGYTDVFEFPGGLSEWESAGYPLEIGEALKELVMADGEYALDTQKSVVGWSGRNIKYAHHGKISVKYGSISVKDGKISNGEVVLDMTTIKDEDLTDDMWRGILEGHLKSSDFFDVEKYPQASFHLAGAEVIEGALGSAPNYELTGELAIKDVKRPINFLAIIASRESGAIGAHTHFDFDRTLWNVRYGSEKFFEKLGMHLVNDTVSLDMFLVAKKLSP